MGVIQLNGNLKFTQSDAFNHFVPMEWTYMAGMCRPEVLTHLRSLQGSWQGADRAMQVLG